MKGISMEGKPLYESGNQTISSQTFLEGKKVQQQFLSRYSSPMENSKAHIAIYTKEYTLGQDGRGRGSESSMRIFNQHLEKAFSYNLILGRYW